MTRSISEILKDQGVTMADLVKAANLNADHMPTTIDEGALLVAQVLSGDAAEVHALHEAIYNSAK